RPNRQEAVHEDVLVGRPVSTDSTGELLHPRGIEDHIDVHEVPRDLKVERLLDALGADEHTAESVLPESFRCGSALALVRLIPPHRDESDALISETVLERSDGVLQVDEDDDLLFAQLALGELMLDPVQLHARARSVVLSQGSKTRAD